MFHVRRLTAQNKLGILNYTKKYFTNNKSSDLEQIIRIDHSKPIIEQQVQLSANCINRLKELSKLNKFLRVTVDSGGCSGFEYKFSLESSISNEDQIIEKDSCKVLIDKETIEFIKGATIDYHEELIRAGFRILNNPNSEQGCSCGSSFSLKI